MVRAVPAGNPPTGIQRNEAMARQGEQPEAEAAGEESASPPSYPPIGPDAPWSAVWQLPALLLGMGLLALGVWAAMPSHDPPDVDGVLDDAALYLEADNPDEAQAKLELVQAEPDLATPTQLGRMYALYGDLNYLQLNKTNVPYVEPQVVRQTRQDIVGYYRKAEDKGTGYRLKPRRLERLAKTLVDLERDEEALSTVDRLAAGDAAQRYGIIRRMIERRLNRPGGATYEQVAPLLDRFRQELRAEQDTAAANRQIVWATSVHAELWLDADPAKAAEFLNRHIMRLKALGLDDELAPLYVMLARAQQAQEQYDQAMQTFEFAERMLPPSDPLQARVMLGKAQNRLAHGPASDETAAEALHLALHLFKSTVEQFPATPAFIDALIGQADAEARLGQHGPAHDHFKLAVQSLLERTPYYDPRRQKLTDVVISHAQQAAEHHAFERALDLLTLLRPLYGEDLPPDLMLRFARTHEMIAQQNHDAATAADQELTPEARKMHNQEAAIHFGKSAEYYWDYARAMAGSDDKAHGDALWQAARNFDRAQLWEKAIRVYDQFVEQRGKDHRLLQAMHLLGKARMANEDYASAINLFKELQRDHPQGRWTYESLVPLARAYAATDQLAAARSVLIQTTTDHPAITPDSDIYKDALIELGRIYYESGREDPANYLKAIETLTEAVERYGRDPEGATLRYLLADANRKSVATLDEKLRQQRSQRELIALQAERLRRLEEAQIYYNQVITELEDRPEASLSPLERTYYRNAYFFQADCAFDRGQFEQAIALYDEAAKRWERDPSSLVAHVQIVNAYCELGKYDAAKRANEKALWALERMPDEVFEDPTLPMTRRHWEDWLRWASELDLFGAQANAQ